MPNVFEALSFVNPSGKTIKISDTSVTKYWELRGRSGFSAPDVELITQRFANGTTKVLKRFIAPRTVRINMVLVGDTTAERDQYFSEMVRDLIDISGGNEGKLYVTRSDGTTVYLNCTYSSGMNVADEYRKFHRFTLEFYAADPYFYKDLPDTVIPIELSNNPTFGLVFDQYPFGYSSLSGSATIENLSSDAIQPVIRMKYIEAFGSYIIIQTSSNYNLLNTIQINNIWIGPNQTLVIDTRDESKGIYIANKNGVIEQAAEYLDWNNAKLDLPIPPGISRVDVYGPYGTDMESAVLQMSERMLSA